MSPRRSGDDPPLLDDRLTAPEQPRPPREPRPPRRSPLAWMSEANPKMTGDDADHPPSRMRPPEDQVGYVIAVVMIIVGIIFAADSSAADAHPIFAIAGTVVAAALPLAILRVANRFVSAIGAIVAAFLISLGQLHPRGGLLALYYVMLISALGYGFWLTRRQGKAARERAGSRSAARSTGSRPRRGKDKAPEPAGPPASRRYTPPQANRSRQTRSEAAAALAPEPSRRERRRAAREAKEDPGANAKTAKSGRR